MALNQIWDQDGNLIESVEVPDEEVNPPSPEDDLKTDIETVNTLIDSVSLDDPNKEIFDAIKSCLNKVVNVL